ncbi:sugar phosphate nucleotidyltransferase [Sulfurovum sp.]|uniref:sugar phosphate nucleotidyltransferase n=1 Tax=Sulfurovum sp. TaxID=1969726 RepID=UPI0025F14D92|nr:sugar phosphate nucleotidyltransferase [Sulfurovum sp.]
MKAVVMAGGFGTRIQPLTNSRPKPMLPVVNRPMMENTMMTLRDLGITDFIVLLYFKPEVIQDYFGDGSKFGINITYVIPDDDYGTAGAVKLAQEHIGDDNFIIISGDLVTDFDFQKIFEYHKQKESKLTITLTSVENPLEFGVVIANEEGKIEKFLEKPSWGEVFSDTINTGIYIIEPEILKYIPKGENFDFAKDLFPLLMKEGVELIAGNAEGYWRDVGNPDSYREVHEDIMSGRVDFKMPGQKTKYPDGVLYSDAPYTLDESIEIIGNVVLGKNVSIGKRTKLKNSVISDNVKIGKDCKVSNSVIWENVSIGKGTKIDNAVICNNNVIGRNSKMTAGIILAEGCEIGELVTVEKDVTIWPDKKIEDAAIVSSNVILGSRYRNSIFENGMVVGKSNVELSCEMSSKLAEAFGAQLPVGSSVLIGRDHHKSSRMLKRAFVGGILASGVNVVDLKNIPSSVMRYDLANSSDYVAGIYFKQVREDTTSTVVTFFNDEALKINNDLAKKTEKIYFKESFRRVDFSQIGKVSESHRIEECTNYKKKMEESFQKRLFSCVDCRIAVDMMHGTSCEVFPYVLNELNIGNMIFNNYHDAHRLANFKSMLKHSVEDMQKIVRSLELDAGFLLYPFGQRLDIVCDKGELLSMQDSLLVVLALMDIEAAKEGRKRIFLPTWAPDMIKFDNLDIEYGKYADFKAENLRQYDLIATADGNFAFTEFSLYRDSMYAAVKILEMIIKHDVKLSELVTQTENFYHTQTTITCPQSLKGTMMRKFLEDARGKRSSSDDGVKIWLNETDWILMIPDQYSDHLNLYIQAENESAGQAIYDQYKAKIESWAK